MKKMLAKLLRKAYYRIMWLSKSPSNTVLFMSYNGKQYSDNPKAISLKMHELYPKYKIVWAVDDVKKMKNLFPEYVDLIPSNGKEFYRALSTCFCFVTNTHNESNIEKRKHGQIFIQTWHGDIGFKKVLYDCWPDGNRPHPVVDALITDLCIAGSDYGIEQYRSAFRYKGKILTVGTPRNDRLVIPDMAMQEQTRTAIGIDSNKKILIYAPTFRDCNKHDQYVNVDLDSVLEALESKGDDWVCLLRAHSNTKSLHCASKSSKIIDVSSYPDMADLLAIGDLLITDYSSCAADFIRKGSGAILATFDLEDYIANNRDIPFDFKEKGFLVAENQNQLLEIIKEYTEDMYRENAEDICRRFNVVESGKSAERICEIIHDYRNRGIVNC